MAHFWPKPAVNTLKKVLANLFAYLDARFSPVQTRWFPDSTKNKKNVSLGQNPNLANTVRLCSP
jgi:hypothetical protein